MQSVATICQLTLLKPVLKESYILPNGKNKSATYRGTNLNKSLLLIPYRFAMGMLEMGWKLRNIINWTKPNQMPSSAKDRFTVDYEPIFFFVKQDKYFFNQQFEPYEKELNRWGGEKVKAKNKSDWDEGTGQDLYRNRNMRPNPAGRNMRTTWQINTVPFKEAHFAVYPESLVERIVLAGCPKGGIMLDPFHGAGTTGLVANKLERNFIGYELNKKYIQLSQSRFKKGFSIELAMQMLEFELKTTK